MNCSICLSPSGNPSYLLDRYKVYQERSFSVTVCRCVSCQKEFYVTEDPGYHTPSYQWSDNRSHIEQMMGEAVSNILYK